MITMVGKGTTGKEPTKMSPDEKPPIAENEGPKEEEQVPATELDLNLPLTKEQFAAQIEQLAERARAAGLSPIRALAQSYARQGMGILEGLLASLENAGDSKKKKEK